MITSTCAKQTQGLSRRRPRSLTVDGSGTLSKGMPIMLCSRKMAKNSCRPRCPANTPTRGVCTRPASALSPPGVATTCGCSAAHDTTPAGTVTTLPVWPYTHGPGAPGRGLWAPSWTSGGRSCRARVRTERNTRALFKKNCKKCVQQPSQLHGQCVL